MRLRLSIIVPVYNVEQYLERCVDSLLHQDIDKSEYEIILVNDGSTDGSLVLAQRISSSNGNVVLVTQENKGLSEARNTGIDAARGRYVMFVDSDDKLYPNVIGRLLDCAEKNSLDVVESRMMVQGADGSECEDFIQPFLSDQVFSGEEALLKDVHIGSVCTNMYSLTFLKTNGLRFTPGIFHEDVDFNLRMYAFAKRIMFTEAISYFYRYNPVSIDRERSVEKTVKSYRSEFQIAKNILTFSKSPFISPELKAFYSRHENSAIVSCLISLVLRRDLDEETKRTLFEELLDTGLYPVAGRTLSWKTTCMMSILNIKRLYRLLLSL